MYQAPDPVLSIDRERADLSSFSTVIQALEFFRDSITRVVERINVSSYQLLDDRC